MKFLSRINLFILACILISSNFILLNQSVWQNFFIYTNSDLLYLPSFFRDFWEGDYNWRLWVLTPAPYFFPDAFLFFFTSIFSKNLFISFFIYSILFSFSLIISISLLFSLSLEFFSFSRIIKGVTLCIPLWLILISNYPEDIALFLFPSYHSGSILISIFLFFLSFKLFNRVNVFTFILISTLALASDKQLIYNFFFPFLFSLITIKDYRLEKKYLKVFIYFIFGLAFSSATLKILSHYNIFQIPTIPIYSEIKKILFQFKIIENVKIAMPEIIQFFKELYLDKLPLFILFLLGTALNIYYSFTVSIKNKVLVLYSRYVLFLYLFSILSQAFFGIWSGFRYVWGIYVFPFVSILFYTTDLLNRMLADRNFRRVSSFRGYLFLLSKNRIKSQAIFFALILILALLNIFYVKLKLKDNYVVNNPYPPFISCLDDLQRKYNLQNGISDYWNAKHIRYMSQTHLTVNQVFSNLEKYDWIHNRDWYRHDSEGKNLHYKFIIPERLDTNLIRKKMGNPTIIERCEGREVYIYIEGFKI